MCYAKPGPRCVSSARKAVANVNQKIAESDVNNTELQASLKAELAAAHLEYAITTSGLKEIKDKVTTLRNAGEVEQADKLAEQEMKLQQIRNSRIAASKRIKAENHREETDLNSNENNSQMSAVEASIKFNQEEIDAMKPDHRPPSLINVDYNNIDLADQGISGEHDGKYCSDMDCNQDYCSDGEYSNLRIDTEYSTINSQNILAAKMGCNPELVPSDMVDQFRRKGYDDPDRFEIQSVYGYYGAEGYTIQAMHNEEINDLISSYQKNTGNATDTDGAYELARKNKIETKGLTRIEALNVMLKKQGAIKKDSKGFSSIRSETFSYNKSNGWVRTSQYYNSKLRINTPKSKAYENIESAQEINRDQSAIVYTKLADGSYKILSGFAEFKAIESGRANNKPIKIILVD